MRVRNAAFVLCLLLASCGDDDPATDDTTTTSESTATTAGSEPEATPTTTVAASLAPGDPCSLEEGVPDCIDPDGDGEGVYLLGVADCIAALPDSPELCTDLDGDGNAGYPDSG